MEVVDVVIIGSGPAGLSAAIYAGRAGLNAVVLQSMRASSQILNTSVVENYPGFPEPIEGYKLVEDMGEQAKRYGATIMYKEVVGMVLDKRPFAIRLAGDDELQTRSIIVATGAAPLKLTCPGADKFWGRGISSCAVCDSFLAKDKVVAVVGGGDVACEEATYLTKVASKVYLIHRRDKLRATQILQRRVFESEKITILFNTQIQEILGDDTIRELRLSVKDDGEHTLPIDCLFYGIGHAPSTDFVDESVAKEDGYILIGENHEYPHMTSVPGVFAAGDCCDRHYKQAIVAAGAGASAAIDAERWLGNE